MTQPEETATIKSQATSLIARLKQEAKKHAVIYYPVHYFRRAIHYTKLFTKWQLHKLFTRFNPNGLNKTEHRQPKIIASLTSYPARIYITPYAIASILNQTMKPDKIILWLGESQFPGRKLPDIYKKVKACGVDIEFREDIGSHKKYFYAMKEYPDDIIITFDDDFIYDSDIIETLYDSYMKHPDCVSAMRVHRIKFEDDGGISPYMSWEMECSGEKGHESHQYLATNGAGSIFPPHCLPDETFNTEAVKRLCPRADDMWLKFMEAMNGTKVVPASNEGRIPGREVFGSQGVALWKSNNLEEGNDVQIRAVLEEHGILPDGRRMLDILKEDSSDAR